MARVSVRSLSLLVLGGTFSLALTACGGGGGGGGEQRIVTDFSACDQKPDVGVSAISDNARHTEWVESEYFDKPYDRFDLEAVLDASSTSTTDYVRSLGITLNRVPRKNMANVCPTYFNLPEANPTHAAIWAQAAGGNTGNGKLAGLFFELCGGTGLPGCSERKMVSPTILVDEASDRWTLVHEMMHYNFNQGRKASTTLPPSSYLERATKGYAGDMKKSFEAYKALPNRGDLTDTVADLRKLVELGRDVFVRRALEEVSIEGMLIGLWSDGKLRNVSDRAPASGVWYMSYSRDQFFPTLAPLEEMVAEFKKAAEENFWPEIVENLDETMAMIQDQKTETQSMIDAAKAKIKAKQNSEDEAQFSNAPMFAPLFTAGDEEVSTFNVVTFEAAARAHLESHDEGGIQKAFSKITKELAREITGN